jgi:hypothetical protein
MIKRILGIIIIASSLGGCMVLDAFLMTHYDSNEFAAIADIRARANVYKTQCTDPVMSKINAQDIVERTQYFQYFEEHVPRNKEGYNSSKTLNTMAQELNSRYQKSNKVSKMYCELKFGAIENSSNLIQHVLAGRPR